MISFTEYRKRQLVEADVAAPETPAAPSAHDKLTAEIEKEINNLFDNIKRVLYNRAVPNKAGTGFLGGLRNWWWRLWYGDPTKNRDHPMYSKGGWNKEPDLDYRRGETPAPAKTESVVPRLRLMAEWNRAIDEAEEEIQALTEDASNWADIERAIDSMKAPFIQHVKDIISRHGVGGGAPSVPGKPAGSPPVGSPASTPASAPTGSGAVGDLDAPAKGTPAGGTADPEKLAGSDTPPPPHVVKTSEREPGAYPPGLRVDGRRGTLKGHTHDVLYKTYRDAKNSEFTTSGDLAKAVDAGTAALHKKLDELPLRKMKELGLAYGWHPPSFGYSSYGAAFMKTVLTFYIRKELGEHPPVPKVLKEAGYTGDGFTPHTPRPPKAKTAPAAGTVPPGKKPAPPGTAPAPGTPTGSTTPAAASSPAAPTGSTTPAAASSPAAPAGTDEKDTHVKALTDAFHKVNWPALVKAITDGSVKPGTEPWIDTAKFKEWIDLIDDAASYDNAKWAATVFHADNKAPSEKRLGRAMTSLEDYGVKGGTPDEKAQKLNMLAGLYSNGSGSPDPAPTGTDGTPPPGDAPAASTPASDPAAASSSPTASAAPADPKLEELKKSIRGYRSFDDEDKEIADKLAVTALKAGLDGDQTNTAFKNYMVNHSDLKGAEMDAILGDEEKVKSLAGVSPAAASTPAAPPLPDETKPSEPVTPSAAAPAAPAAPAPETKPEPASSPAVGDLEPPTKGVPGGVAPPAPTKAAPEPEPEDEKTIPRVAKASPEENLEKVQKWRTDNEAAYKSIMNLYQTKFPDDKEHVGGSLLNTILIHYPSWTPDEVQKVMMYIANNSDEPDDVANWAEPKGAADGIGLGRAFALAHGKKASDVSDAKPVMADIPKTDDLRAFQPKGDGKKAKKKSGAAAESRQENFDAVFGGAGKKASDWGSREKMNDMVFTLGLDHVDKSGKFSGHYRHLLQERGMKPNEARRLVMDLLKGFVSSGEYPPMEVLKADEDFGGDEEGFERVSDRRRERGRTSGGKQVRRKRLEEIVQFYKNKLRTQAETGYVKQPDRVEMSGMSISEKVNYLRSLLRERV